MTVETKQPQEITDEELFPWTVMIKYLRTETLFFVTDIDVETPEEAVAEVLKMGYCLPKTAFEMTAKRVATLPPRVPNADTNKIKPVQRKEAVANFGVRATSTRK